MSQLQLDHLNSEEEHTDQELYITYKEVGGKNERDSIIRKSDLVGADRDYVHGVFGTSASLTFKLPNIPTDLTRSR
jgi:hypothetical protein